MILDQIQFHRFRSGRVIFAAEGAKIIADDPQLVVDLVYDPADGCPQFHMIFGGGGARGRGKATVQKNGGLVGKFPQAFNPGGQAGHFDFPDAGDDHADIAAIALKRHTQDPVAFKGGRELLVHDGAVALGEIAERIQDAVVDQGQGRQIAAFPQRDFETGVTDADAVPPIGDGADDQASMLGIKKKKQCFMNIKQDVKSQKKDPAGALLITDFHQAFHQTGHQRHFFDFAEHGSNRIKFFKPVENMMVCEVGRHQP